MAFILFIVLGLLIGLVARAVMPNSDSLGALPAMLLGVLGAVVGGFVGNMVLGAAFEAVTPSGFLGAFAGAFLVLAVAAPLLSTRRMV